MIRGIAPSIFVKVSVGFPKVILEKPIVDGFYHRVQAGILIVHVQTSVGLSRRCNAHPAKQQKAQVLSQERWILQGVVEHKRPEAQEALRWDISIKFNLQTWLEAVAAAGPAGAHGDVSHPCPSPIEFRRVMSILQIVRLQVGPVVRMEVESNFVQN